MNLMWFMRSKRVYGTCYTTTTCEVHTFLRTKRKENLQIFKRHFCLSFSRSCKFIIIETRTWTLHRTRRDELINQPKYRMGSGRKQPSVIYNKNFPILTEKYLCWSLFLIKNFKATLFKRDSNTGVFL